MAVSSFFGLQTSLRGLIAQQTLLDTAGHNISNASTDGYSRQKVNLALALLGSPGVLLLDEPYQGFDWETYLRFWDLVADLRARRTAVVIITHLVFEQDRYDLLADLAGGHLTPRQPAGKDHRARA